MNATRGERIRALNDLLRRTQTGGRVMITRGVAAKGDAFVDAALDAIAGFDAFDEANDPYLEHDFGVVDVDGQRVLWKIDYYDQTLTSAAVDPADAAACVRVMTVMLTEEY